MQNFNDNYSFFDENDVFSAAIYSVIGDRSEQQDSAGAELFQNGGIITVCDGMGGQEGGKAASTLVVNNILNLFKNSNSCKSIRDLLITAAKTSDKAVAALSREDGTPLNSGTTCVTVVIYEKSLYWLSVGDSRIYIFRNGEFVRATRDHNYFLALEKDLDAGNIDAEHYEREKTMGEALISYLGIGNLDIIDCNEKPMGLMPNDEILLMSDGLYKILSDDEIQRIILNFKNISEALRTLDAKAKKVAAANNISRDNMTPALIKIK